MEILVYTLCAATLVALGAAIAGRWQPPRGAPRACGALDAPSPQEDDFGRDLAALLRYGGAEPPCAGEQQEAEQRRENHAT